MVQDLLIQTYVYRHATPFSDDRAFAAVPDMHLFDAVSQTFERLRIMGG